MSSKILGGVAAWICPRSIAVCAAGPPGGGETAKHQHARRLNMMQLLRVDVTSEPCQVWEFVQPRHGWVFFSVPQAAREMQPRSGLTLDGALREQSILRPGACARRRSMRYPAAGTHRIQAWAEHGRAAVLTVRSIPEIIFLHFTGDLALAGRFAVQADPVGRRTRKTDCSLLLGLAGPADLQKRECRSSRVPG